MDQLTPQKTEENIQVNPAKTVVDVSLSTFIAEVIEASRERLVIVDFWAPWCAPCKQLGPVLVKVVKSFNGAVRLAKIDIEKCPEIAQQMRVQSIPAVFAFFKGQPVDGFMGTLPEKQIKAWIERLLKALGNKLPQAAGGFAEALAQAREFLASGDSETAQAVYEGILTDDPKNAEAKAGLVRCKTAKELAEQAGNAAASLDELKARVNAEPDDHQARFDLAMACYGAGQREEAVDELLEIARRARAWNDEAARKQLLKLFETFGFSDPLSVSGRRRLSSVLFS